MVTIDQAMRGVAQYADNEIIPHLPTGKGIGAGIALALIMDGGKSRILALKDHHRQANGSSQSCRASPPRSARRRSQS